MNHKPIDHEAEAGINGTHASSSTPGLRTRIQQRGAEMLTDAELLAIVLGAEIPESKALDNASELLEKCGGLQQLLWDNNIPPFGDAGGLVEENYAYLKAGVELIRRSLRTTLEQGPLVNRATDICYFLKSTFGGTDHEVFAAFWLDTKHQLLSFEELFTGTLNYIHIYPREVVKKALNYNAAGLIFAHNHPVPHNEYDYLELLKLTQPLIDGLELINVEVLDYFVVGAGECVSLKYQGLM